MKIWIVTQGEYSGYRIMAVFESEDQAKEFINGTDAAEIEEWDTGIPEGGIFRDVYGAQVSVKTGDVDWVGSSVQVRSDNWSESYITRSSDQRVAVGHSAVSPDHALKIAVEARQAELRETPK
jgi:hypothetical protein